MHDLLGDELRRWKTVETTIRSVLESFGYDEIRTPVLEPKEVFSQAVGDDTDIVEKQMYQVEDRGSRAEGAKPDVLVLRPEATASVVRAILEHQLLRNPGPQRFYYCLPMFRYERPQKGRLRQFHQIGIELIQDPSPEADAECILIFDTVLKKLGLTEYEIRINSLGSEKSRPVYRKALVDYLRPHLSQLCEQCQRRFERSPLRVLDCKNESCQQIAAKAPRVIDHLDPESAKHHERVKSILQISGVDFVEDPTIVRGLDYYSRTAFEFTSELLGAQSALGGGGRYDELAGRFGAESFPAIGWALGLERVMIALEAKSLSPQITRKPVFFFAPLGDAAFERLLPLSFDLKRAGIWVEIPYDRDKKLKWMMKQADRVGAEYTLLIGEDELKSGQGVLKRMSDGTQQAVPLADLEARLTRIANE